ncbi:thioester reductase [Echinicola strongylocentroti]|uniref:Thioester reductase n=1 Tax=Echinicola strongylocentroti TaxID=1795355 RepID=A0A2Z4IIQ4_9BACT|nr:amino acid adenylation domain-containing protein [Echinicola strongylocentroti]AWW30824.1 thioester reductase [Echinicola strongylocentroti]
MRPSKTTHLDAEHFLASHEASSPLLEDILSDLSFDAPTSVIDQPFVNLLHQVAFTHPDKTAVEYQQQTISYLDLEEKSNQMASFLADGKVKEGSILAIALDRSIEMVIAMLGILKAGCAYLPVDPKLPHERIQYMLEDADVQLIITSKPLLQEVRCKAEKLHIDTLLPILDAYSPAFVDRISSASSLAYVLYTSGSTGNPKGVKISHKNLTNLLLSVKKKPGLNAKDRLLAITTISFDIAGIELFLPLITGATVVLAEATAIKDGRLLHKLLREKDISFMQATPATWRMLVMAGWEQPLPLRILSGGEAFPKDLALLLLRRCDEVWNGYGPTETTIYSTMKKLAITDPVITIGKPIAHTGIYVLDENQLPVKNGTIGEIHISGEGVADGYLNRPELTTERFVPNPFSHNFPVLYKTGDLGRILPTGDIECLGRIDHQVKIRGFRIELGEIEQQLLEETAIKEVAVHPWEDTPGNKRLASYVVLNDPSQAAEGTFAQLVTNWKENLSKKLPEYMIPADWIPMDQLPLTANQKIDRKGLPKPKLQRTASLDAIEKPGTETEKTIHAIWCKSFRVPSISIDTDFFDMGGHSLLAVEVMTKVDRESGKNLPLTTLFSYPTIRKFAAHLDQSSNDHEWRSLVPIKPNGHKTPIYLVHGMAANAGTFFKFTNRLHEDQPIYGLQSKGLNGKDAPNHTIQEMAEHYVSEILEHDPNGPYILGGYSFGGYVAFEMARILIKKGKTVQSVIMFDTQAVNLPLNDHLDDSALSRLKAKFVKKKVEFQVMLKAPKAFQQIKTRAAKRKRLQLLQKIGRAEAPTSDDRTAVIKRIRALNYQAMISYRPQPLEVPTVVFKAKIVPSKSSDHWANGWTNYSNNVKVIPVEGDHFTLFEEPFVDDVGKKLNMHLKESSH